MSRPAFWQIAAAADARGHMVTLTYRARRCPDPVARVDLRTAHADYRIAREIALGNGVAE